MKLRIRQPDLHPSSASVELDGIDITKSLHKIRVEWEAASVTVAHVEIRCDEVDIDTETLAHLNVIAKVQEAAA